MRPLHAAAGRRPSARAVRAAACCSGAPLSTHSPPLGDPADLSDQLQRALAHNSALRARVDALDGAVARLQRGHEALAASPRGAAAAAWHAASFLLLFLAVINVAGGLASLHLAASSFAWFGWWGVKQQAAGAAGAALARPLLAAVSAAVPIANAAVVLVLCVQAVKAAWRCVRY